MANRKPKAGDEVLLGGQVLQVDYTRDTPNGLIVHCKQPELIARRESAKVELGALRARQVAADRNTPDGYTEWEECARQIRAIDAELRAISTKVGLRADLLFWVPERRCWGRVGQMLSAEQTARFIALVGKKPNAGDGELAALKFLDAQD